MGSQVSVDARPGPLASVFDITDRANQVIFSHK